MPLTDEEQLINARIITEGLHLKHDEQLPAMRVSHAAKISRIDGDLDEVTNFPDSIRWKLKQEGMTAIERDEEFAAKQVYCGWKKTRLEDIVFLIRQEEGFRRDKKVTRNPIGTTFFIDSDNGSNANAGTSTGAAWATLDKMTEEARSPGDIAILRNSMTARYDDGTDLNFTSDGTIDDPIILQRDYANAFADDVDLSATATATFTFGSKTVTYSSDISGVLAAGDWIYAAGDDSEEFSYEVDTVVTTTVTLFLPYKGAQAGSGKTTTNIGSPPIWNLVTGAFQFAFDNDNWWKVQGLHCRGTDPNGVIGINSAVGHTFKDCIFEGNGGADHGIACADDAGFIYASKCRFFNNDEGLESAANSSLVAVIQDCLFDGNSVGGGSGIQTGKYSDIMVSETEFKNHDRGDINCHGNPASVTRTLLRNCVLSSTTEVDAHDSVLVLAHKVFSEDHDGVIGDGRQLTYLSNAEGTPIIQTDTSKSWASGQVKGIKITPSTKLSTNSELSRQLVWEFPFYATTSAKTYTAHFVNDATADWTTDPTASEFWIEAEYWGHSSNNFRRIIKSTGVVDFNGSTAEQTLTVTITPDQTGVLYLRCYYAKPKEAGSNIFYADPEIVVT